MENSRVLILDGQNINALAFVRQMGKLKNYVAVLSQSFLSLSFFSNYSNKNHIINKNLDDYSYVLNIVQIANKYKYKVIIPLSLKSFSNFSKHRNLVTSNLRIVLPPSDSMIIASKKHKTFEHAKKIGLGYPETIQLESSNLSKLKSFVKKVGYPLVIKGSISGVENLFYCNNNYQLVRAVRELLKKEKIIVCQEYIEGQTNGFYAYYIDNKLHSYFMHKRIKEYPITGGPSSVARSYYDHKLKEISEKLLNSLKWNGPAMVEYKLDEKSKEYKLIEINPKLWGSLDLTINSGVNIPRVMLSHSLGIKSRPSNDYKDIYFRWTFPNDFMHNLATGFKNTKLEEKIEVRTNVLREDLLPTIFQLFICFFKAINYLIKGKLKHPSGKPFHIV